MSGRRMRRLAPLLMLPAAAGPAWAADPAEPAVLDSVVVPVERSRSTRSVEVQKTPAAITSLSGAKLEEQGVGNVRELGNIVPNLYQPRTAVSYLNSAFYLRGIGEPDAQGEPSVAVYFDDLYWSKNLGANVELLDIERVEIFRGPQGQAFGHSALAGVLRVNSTVPTATARLRAVAEAGNYNQRRLGFAASGPLNDQVLGSAAATLHKRGGFTPNVTVGRDTNDVDYAAARGKLVFRFGPAVEATFTGGLVRDESTARGVQNLAYGDEYAHNQIYPANDYKSRVASSVFNIQLSRELRLKLLAGYTHFDQLAFFDNTGDFYGRGSQLVRYIDTTYQYEAQLAGSYERFDFTAGLYAYSEDWFTNRRANTAANAATDPALIRYRPVYTIINQGTVSRAAYGEVRYKATQALTLSAGLRYNHEQHSHDNQLYNLVAAAPFQSTAANFLSVINAPPQALVWDTGPLRRKWDTWAPKAALDFQWRRGLLQYLSYAEGTKSAGYDYRAQGVTTNGQPPAQAVLPFNPEKSRNIETGLKSDWFDGALRANVALFRTRFDDVQLTTTDPTQTPAVTRRFNAGQASTRGLEIEAAWVPSDGLQIDANAAWVKARLDRFDGVPATLTTIPASSVNPDGLVLRSAPFTGAELPNAPKRQGRLAATWRLPLPGPGAWVLNGSVSYQDASYSDATDNPTVRLPSQTYLNGGITYIPGGGAWSLTLAGQNLANKRYVLGPGFTQRTTPTLDGSAIYRTTNYNDPRTVSLALKYEL